MQMATNTEKKAVRVVGKARDKLAVVDHPGELLMIPKDLLFVDPAYQRKANKGMVSKIAANWSWASCGALSVANRGDVYYVFDGWHRASAAQQRDDIAALPCIVFELAKGVQAEAQAFVQLNTERRSVNAVDKFNAKLTAGDPLTQLVAARLHQIGKEPGYGGKNARNTVACITRILWAFSKYRRDTEALWPMFGELFRDQYFYESVFAGLVWLEVKLAGTPSLAETHWRKRILDIGVVKLNEAACRSAAYHKVNRPDTFGPGILDAINYKARNRLELP